MGVPPGTAETARAAPNFKNDLGQNPFGTTFH